MFLFMQFFTFLFLSFFIATSLHANQVDVIERIQHSKQLLSNHKTRHAYQIDLSTGHHKALILDLSLHQYDPQHLHFPRSVSSRELYTHPEFNREINFLIDLYLQANPGSFIDYQLSKQGKLTYRYQSSDPLKTKQFIERIIHTAADKVMKEAFHLTRMQRSDQVIFDYAYAAKTQLHVTSHLAKQIHRLTYASTSKARLALLLSFVQSIPYDHATMTRPTFRTPLAVLSDHTGDCDEKSLLLALMLKTAFPNQKSALLVSNTGNNDHAISLLEWPWPFPGRVYLNGEYYLPLETTDKHPIGYLPPIMKRALKHRLYEVIPI